MEQAAEDAAQAALVSWNDPKLAALARGDAAFRAAVLSEILQVATNGFTKVRMFGGAWDVAAARGATGPGCAISPPRRHRFR